MTTMSPLCKFGNKHALDIGLEGVAVDRAIKHERRDQRRARSRSPGLVDEDQTFGIEIKLAFEPGLAPLQDVGAVLLDRVRRLFLRVMAWRAKKRRIVP
jgi:hypothetical protein